MLKIPPSTLFSGVKYFYFTSLVNAPFGAYPSTPTSPFPGMIGYGADPFIANSSDSNSLDIGSKSFSYAGASPSLAAGNLVKIQSYSSVSGYMLGSVTSYTFSGGISSINVDVYEVHGTGTSSQWHIQMQLNNGEGNVNNVFQNPNSPHLAKLRVADVNDYDAYASFNVPANLNSTTVITSDTPTHFASYTTTKWGWRTFIIEDFGDLHEPWVGTTLTVRVKIRKDTETLDGITTEYSFRDYNHTFTYADFDIYSAYFVPGDTYPATPTPSSCENYSDGDIDEFTSTVDIVRNSEGTVISLNNVTYTFDTESYVINVTPGSFFEPPTP